MDVASLNIININKTNSFVKMFDEIVPFQSCNSTTRNVSSTESAEFSVKKSVANEDALQAVKLDPAVLEAQVTYKTMQCDESLPDDQFQLPIAKFRGRRKLDRTESKHFASFKAAVSQAQAALLSLTPHQYDLLLSYVDTLRRQRTAQQMAMECGFCKNNGEALAWYSSHALKDWRGRVLCPVLRALRCPRCGATGDRAHTIKYCHENGNADQ